MHGGVRQTYLSSYLKQKQLLKNLDYEEKIYSNDDGVVLLDVHTAKNDGRDSDS